MTSPTVTLKWKASRDNIAVDRYRIYRDGKQVNHTTHLSYVDRLVTRGAHYYYTVTAVDAAGNESAHSTPISLTVPR